MHAREKQVAAGIALFSTLVLLSGTATAANTPSHPLSHITPTDTDLNFSNNPNAQAHDITGLGAIRNFFANNCAADEAIQYINEDGTFQCAKLETGDVNGSGSATEVAFFADSSTITSDSNLYFDDLNNRLGIQTSTPQRALDVSGSATIRGNLNMDSGSIQNFFANACPDGEAIADINDDGSYTCRPLGDVDDVWVNQTGDTMTGNLNMTGNNITELRALSGFFDNACTGGNVVREIYDNGTVACMDPSESTENLSQTLAAGNEAGSYDIDMTGNNIRNINALSVSQALTDDNVSDTITVDASGIRGTIANPIDTGFFTTSTPLTDGNLSTAITIGPSGSVNSSAIEPRIAGNHLTYTDGVLDVNDGAGSGLNADTLDGKDSDHYRQNLSQVLVEGNRANTSIDMAGNSITTIGDLGGTGIVDSSNIVDSSIIADDIAPGSVNTTHIMDGTIVDSDVSDAANLDLNSLSVAQPLEDGNISHSISINNGPLYAQNGGAAVGIGTNTPGADLDVEGSASVTSSGTDMQVQDDGDVVITLGSG